MPSTNDRPFKKNCSLFSLKEEKYSLLWICSLMLLLVLYEIIRDTENVYAFLQVTVFQSRAEYNYFLKTFPLLPFLPVKIKKSILRKIGGQGDCQSLNIVNISAYNEETCQIIWESKSEQFFQNVIPKKVNLIFRKTFAFNFLWHFCKSRRFQDDFRPQDLWRLRKIT